jgi:hypothetical protein
MILPKKPAIRSGEPREGTDVLLAATKPIADTTASFPLDEGDVAVRVATGELVRLDIDGSVPVRVEVLAQLRANAFRARGGRHA